MQLRLVRRELADRPQPPRPAVYVSSVSVRLRSRSLRLPKRTETGAAVSCRTCPQRTCIAWHMLRLRALTGAQSLATDDGIASWSTTMMLVKLSTPPQHLIGSKPAPGSTQGCECRRARKTHLQKVRTRVTVGVEAGLWALRRVAVGHGAGRDVLCACVQGCTARLSSTVRTGALKSR